MVIENYDSKSDNIDDMDEVCNFSGINNISYTGKDKEEDKTDLFNENIEDNFQRAHSPKPIFHKKIKFASKYKNINKTKDKDNLDKINKKEKINEFNYIEDEINNLDITEDINIDNKLKENIKTQEIKNDIYDDNNNLINENNKVCINSNKKPNTIYTSSQGYFSFKIKKNNNNQETKESIKESIKEDKNEAENNKSKKINESIMESVASSKFNFKINDDVHESEFNDIDFLE